jgi:hypothetical protein
MNKYYPVIARAVERLDGSTRETRRAVYERARKAVALLRANQPALLDADMTKECLALEEAILKVEAEAACCLGMETGAEARSPASAWQTENCRVQLPGPKKLRGAPEYTDIHQPGIYGRP